MSECLRNPPLLLLRVNGIQVRRMPVSNDIHLELVKGNFISAPPDKKIYSNAWIGLDFPDWKAVVSF